jgi:hypothetical protein
VVKVKGAAEGEERKRKRKSMDGRTTHRSHHSGPTYLQNLNPSGELYVPMKRSNDDPLHHHDLPFILLKKRDSWTNFFPYLFYYWGELRM